MAKPNGFWAVNLIFLGLIFCQQHHVIVDAAKVDCSKPMKPVTKSQAAKLKKRGREMFTDDPSQFSPLLPQKLVTEKDFFKFKITSECTDGKYNNQWAISYSANNTNIKQTLTEYPPAATPCKKWHQATKWHKPEIFYGLNQPRFAKHMETRINRNCSRGWRPMKVTPTRTEDVAYEQLMMDLFQYVVMPFTKRKRPFYYCNAGVQKMEFSRIGACFKELASTVRIDGKKYGRGKRAARAWGQVDYTCYGENNVQTICKFFFFFPLRYLLSPSF
jgi:hypothetical protein